VGSPGTPSAGDGDRGRTFDLNYRPRLVESATPQVDVHYPPVSGPEIYKNRALCSGYEIISDRGRPSTRALRENRRITRRRINNGDTGFPPVSRIPWRRGEEARTTDQTLELLMKVFKWLECTVLVLIIISISCILAACYRDPHLLLGPPASRCRRRRSTKRQPYVRSVLCPTSIIYPSGSRM
jgi:hypothetical protein